MIKILLTLNANDCEIGFNEDRLMDQGENIIAEICDNLKEFLSNKNKPMSTDYEDIGLKITWYK